MSGPLRMVGALEGGLWKGGGLLLSPQVRGVMGGPRLEGTGDTEKSCRPSSLELIWKVAPWGPEDPGPAEQLPGTGLDAWRT